MEPFAGVEDVQRRLDFTLDELEQGVVTSHLEDMSDEARYHAGREWPDPLDVPNLVKRTVIKCVARWARNMNGYIVSRAGDETLTWADLGPEAGAPEFTAKEIKLLKAMGSQRKEPFFGTAELYAHTTPGTSAYDGRLPVSGSPKTIPFYNPLTDGW